MNKESSGLCPGLFFTSFYLKTVQKIYVFFIVVDTKELGNQTDIVGEAKKEMLNYPRGSGF